MGKQSKTVKEEAPKKETKKVNPKEVNPKDNPKEVKKDNPKETKNESSTKNLERGDRPNLDTALVNLEVNVRPFKKWLKEHYYNQSLDCKINSAHYAMAACVQIICNHILSGVRDKFKKTQTMLDLNCDTLIAHVRSTKHLAATYGSFIDNFDPAAMDFKLLCVDIGKLNEYISKSVFHGNSTIMVNTVTLKFLYFLLVESNKLLANTAFELANYKKKGSSVTGYSILSAVKIHFKDTLRDELVKKLENVLMILKTKPKSSKKDSKDEKGQKTKDTKEDNSEDDSEDDSEEESDEESDDEEKGSDESDEDSGDE